MSIRRLSELRSLLERVKTFLGDHQTEEALGLQKELEGFLVFPRLNWFDIPGGAFEAQVKSDRKTTFRLWVWEDESGSWNWDIHEGLRLLRTGEAATLNAAFFTAEQAVFALGLA
jgi:hypothetical protein